MRFKKLEDARIAVRDLNDAMIRGKRIKVSFAKYDKNGKPWDSAILQEDDSTKESMGKELKTWKTTSGVRSFKEVTLGVPHQQQGEVWARKSPYIAEGSDTAKSNKELDKVKLKGIVLRVVEDVFKTENLVEIKWTLGGLMVEALSMLQIEEVILGEHLAHREGVEETRSEGEEEQSLIFLEEDLVRSMRRKDQDGDGEFELPLTEEASAQSWTEVGPMRKSAEEVKFSLGSSLKDRSPLVCSSIPNEVGLEDPNDSSPSCPLGFEGLKGLGGHPNPNHFQRTSAISIEGENYVEKGIEIDQSAGDSVDKVPQTPLFEPLSNMQDDVNNVEGLCEEELVEAQITWDIGKMLGCKVSNEMAMITALTKVSECQDFVIPRKRGRPRKNKGSSKA